MKQGGSKHARRSGLYSPFMVLWSLLLTENIGVRDPNLFEGDMILTAEQRAAAEAGQDVDAAVSRGSIKRGLWRGGVLVYEISSSLRKLNRLRLRPH